MTPPQDLPTGYYRVRNGYFPSGAERWVVARWMRDGNIWKIGDDKFRHDYFDDIGTKVA